jgi:outer membrane protein
VGEIGRDVGSARGDRCAARVDHKGLSKRTLRITPAIGAGLLWLVGAGTSVHAENLQEVYTLALQNDPAYLSSIYQNDASSEIYKQARAILLPSLDFTYNKTNTHQKIISADNQVFATGETDYPTTDYTLSLKQSIYSYSNWTYFHQAKVEVQRAAAGLEEAHQDFLLRVAERYFAVLAEQDTYNSVEAELSAAEKLYELLKVKRKDGLARITDFLDAESRYMGVQARVIEVRNRLNDSLQGLKEIIGQRPVALSPIQSEIPMRSPDPQDADEWIAAAQEQNPAMISSRLAVEVARDEVKRQKGGHYPTLDLVINQNNSKTEGTLFGGGSEVETRDVMLQLKVPLYAGGGVSSKVREINSLLNKAKEDLVRQSRKTERETQAAYEGVKGAIAKADALEKAVESQLAAVKSKTTAFQSGLATTLMVLDAERDLFLARVHYAQARYDYILNTLRLKRAVGSLSEEDIRLVNAWLKS